MEYPYTLVITGPIAAGKSTVSKEVCKRYGYPHISEFIETQVDGETRLQEWIKGYISDEDFQRYIVDSYDKTCSVVAHCSRRVFERSPWDSCNIFYSGYKIDELLDYSEEIMRKWRIPTPYKFFTVVDAERNLNEVLKEVYSIIDDDLMNHVESRTIYLKIGGSTSYKRTLSRGRSSEKSYTLEYLQLICDKYMMRLNIE